MKTIDELFELDNLAREEIRRKAYRKRGIFAKILAERGRHFCGIVGSRGVGKSTILRQLALETEHSFYVSFDTARALDLFALAKTLVEKYGIKALLIDEIHHNREYPLSLKKIYDFLHVKVIFTSSMALSLAETSTDLSRRVKMLRLPPFSFREYILFREGKTPPALTLNDIMAGRQTAEHMRTEYRFEEYLKGGLMPFSLEEPEPLVLMSNILDTVIERDIAAVDRLLTSELGLIRKCVEFIGRAGIDGINYSSLSRNIGITKYKAERYTGLLQKAYILNVVFPSGANVLREPKVLMSLPYRLLFRDYADAIGGLREDFFVEAARIAGFKINYLKSVRGRKTPDYLVRYKGRDIVVEIGGKGKGREQFKGVKVTNKLILSHSSATHGLYKPLFLAGFIEESGRREM